MRVISSVQGLAPVVALGLVVLACLWPIGAPPWPAFPKEAIAGVAVLLLVPAAASRARAAGLGALPLLLAAWAPMLTFLLARDTFVADPLLCMLYTGGFALGVLAASWWCSTTIDAVWWLIGALALLGVLLAAQVLVQQVHSQGALPWVGPRYGRVVANLGQRNHVATVQVIGLVATIAMARRLGAQPWLTVVLALPQAVSMFATGSRSGVLSAIILSAAQLVVRRRTALGRESGWATLMVVHLALGLLAWQGLSRATQDAPLPFARIHAAPGSQVIDPRVQQWLMMAEALRAHPWRGFGWGNLAQAHYDTVRSEAPVPFFEYAHNVVVDILVWAGVPLGVLFLAALAWTLRPAVRATRSAEGRALAACLLPLVVHANLEFPHAYLHLLVPAALLAGALCALGELPGRPAGAPLSTLSGRIAAFVAVLLSAAVIAIAALCARDYKVLESAHRQMRAVFFATATQRVPVPRLLLLDQQAALLWFMDIERVEPMECAAFEQFTDRLLARQAFWPVFVHAAWLQRSCDVQRAEQILTRMCNMTTITECRRGWVTYSQRIRWSVLGR